MHCLFCSFPIEIPEFLNNRITKIKPIHFGFIVFSLIRSLADLVIALAFISHFSKWSIPYITSTFVPYLQNEVIIFLEWRIFSCGQCALAYFVSIFGLINLFSLLKRKKISSFLLFFYIEGILKHWKNSFKISYSPISYCPAAYYFAFSR